MPRSRHPPDGPVPVSRALSTAGLEQRAAVHRVAQEALTNAGHHGHASHVRLHPSLEPDAISLQIEDDGIGFDVKRADSETDQVHLGLVGMRERMQPHRSRHHPALRILSRPQPGPGDAVTGARVNAGGRLASLL